MSNRSYFTNAVSSNEICLLARRLDPLSRIEADTSLLIESTARTHHLDETGMGYVDGPGPITPCGRIGLLIITPELANSIDAAVKIITVSPRRLYIDIINKILDKNSLDYDRTLDDIQAEVSLGAARIDPRAVIMPGTLIGKDVVVEAGAIIFPGAVLEDAVHIKAASLIATSGAAIHIDDNATSSQPHLGTVVIGRNTEIGSQTNIVRGIFGVTRIGRRSVIGNQVNIGHNVLIGHGVWVGAGSILAGYGSVGNFTNIGIGAICKNGIKIGKKCNIAMGSCVTKNIPDGASCIGNPAKVIRRNLAVGPAREFPLNDY